MIRLLLSRFFGALGFQILTTWIAFRVFALAHSPLLSGLLGLGVFGVTVATTLFAGPLSDHSRACPKRWLFGAQIGIALAAIGTVFLADSYLGLALGLVGLTFLRLLRSIFFSKRLAGFFVAGGKGGRIARLNTLSWQIALFIGPLIFTILPHPEWIAIATLTLAASLTFGKFEALNGMNAEGANASARAVWQNLCSALVEFRERPLAFRMWSMDSLVTLFVGIGVLYPFILESQGVDPKLFGWVKGMFSLGSALVCLGVRDHWIERKTEKLFAVSLLGVGACALVFPNAGSFTGFLLLALLMGAFDGVSVIVRDYELLHSFAGGRIGSVTGITLLMLSVSDDLGEFQSGLFARVFGVASAIRFGAGISIVAGLGAAFFRRLDPQPSSTKANPLS